MTTNEFRATPLLGRMQQVAMTYLTRPVLLWAGGLGSLFVSYTMYFTLSEQSDNTEARLLQLVVLPVFLFSLLLALHAKWQFVNPVARLLPGYRTPHISVLAILTILVLGLIPLMGSVVTGTSPLGFAAIIIAVAGPILWAIHFSNFILAYLAMGIGYSSLLPIVTPFWLDPNLPYGPYRLLIFLAGWGLVGFWLWRLASLHEERSDYNITPIAAQFGRASRSERAEQRKLVARAMKKNSLQGWLADRTIDQELAGPPPSPSRLLRHGSMAMSAEWRAVTWFLAFGGMFSALAIVLGVVFGEKAIGNIGLLMMPLMFALFMPGSFLSQLFITRWPFMEAELLRPITRKDYLMGVIRAGLRDTAIQAVAFVGLAFLLVGCFSPERMTPFSVVAFFAAVVAGNFFVASFNIWYASFRNGLLQFFLPMLSMIPIGLVGISFTGIWFRVTKGNPGTLEQVGWSIVALGLASALPLLGLFFLRTAKRRWMNVELG